MRYISDDGNVFNTEQECSKYERQLENQRIKREQLKKERCNRLEAINKQYEKLQDMLSEYEKDYGEKQRPYYMPFYEVLNMLYGK